MENAVSELDSISRKLKSVEKSKKSKPKMMVVDDEPDNLELLFRTFRRDFQVLKAESGIDALEVLAAEGEVAVIISDQRMPEMKGTEFLSRTVPQFPDTVRIILTGFTDVEDLVEAINSGQVYKYITKPWDPNELKAVVQQAAETYYLLKQRTEELKIAEDRTALLEMMVQQAKKQHSLEESLQAIASELGQHFQVDACILQVVEGEFLGIIQGTYSAGETVANLLAEDPLVIEAIASGEIQVATDAAKDIKVHLAIPITYGKEVLAVLSLQWKQPRKHREDELKAMILLAEQIALVIICHRYSAFAGS